MIDFDKTTSFDDFSHSDLIDCKDCMDCDLHKERQNVVFNSGNPNADLMLIGEGPGQQEDEEGLPFVGRSGQLLTKILESVGINRDDIYIANIKCRLPKTGHLFNLKWMPVGITLFVKFRLSKTKNYLSVRSAAINWLWLN